MKKQIKKMIYGAAITFFVLSSCNKSASVSPKNPIDSIQTIISGKMSLTVNYSEPIDSLLFGSNSVFVVGLITDVVADMNSFVLTGAGTKTITVELISFTRPISTDTIMMVMAHKNLVPANIQELLTYMNTTMTDRTNLPSYSVIGLGTTIPTGKSAGAAISIGNLNGDNTVWAAGAVDYWDNPQNPTIISEWGIQKMGPTAVTSFRFLAVVK